MKMKKINLGLEGGTNAPEEVPEVMPEKKKLKKKKLLIALGVVLFLVLFGLFFLVLPLLGLKKSFTTLSNRGTEISASFQAQDFKAVSADLEPLKQDWEGVKSQYRRLAWLNIVPYFGGFYRDGNHLMKAGSSFLEAAEVAGQALEPYHDILGLDKDEEKSEEEGQTEERGEKEEKEAAPLTVEERLIMVLDTLDALAPQFDQIGERLAEAKAETDQIKVSRYPETIFGRQVRSRVAAVVGMIDSSAQVVGEIKPIISYLKPLLGIPDEKIYFLLFQNDAELRPSGGFMTAYAFLSVHNGQVKPLESHDIYWVDGRFGNKIPAPEPIKDYLPNVNYWHLRDMNLSPDFAESMKVFWENYEKVPGVKKADGIIAVDTQVLVEILRVLGQIGVSGWGNFSAENDPRCDCPQVFYELEKYADQPINDWRAERKGIIGPLMHAVMGNMMGSPRKQWPQFMNTFLAAVKNKHLLFYFFEEELQGAIEALNAGGRIKEFDGDYFHLNDANFGGAKSNMYIREKVVQTISREPDNSLVKTVTIDYRNPAPPSNCNLEAGELCLNGLYRNWFRLYVPQGSELLESTGSEVEVKTYEELGKTVFEGFYGLTPGTTLKPEGKLSLSFKYRLPQSLAEKEDYRLLIQKQPGAANHEYEVVFGNQQEVFELDADKELQL